MLSLLDTHIFDYPHGQTRKSQHLASDHHLDDSKAGGRFLALLSRQRGMHALRTLTLATPAARFAEKCDQLPFCTGEKYARISIDPS